MKINFEIGTVRYYTSSNASSLAIIDNCVPDTALLPPYLSKMFPNPLYLTKFSGENEFSIACIRSQTPDRNGTLINLSSTWRELKIFQDKKRESIFLLEDHSNFFRLVSLFAESEVKKIKNTSNIVGASYLFSTYEQSFEVILESILETLGSFYARCIELNDKIKNELINSCPDMNALISLAGEYGKSAHIPNNVVEYLICQITGWDKSGQHAFQEGANMELALLMEHEVLEIMKNPTIIEKFIHRFSENGYLKLESYEGNGFFPAFRKRHILSLMAYLQKSLIRSSQTIPEEEISFFTQSLSYPSNAYYWYTLLQSLKQQMSKDKKALLDYTK